MQKSLGTDSKNTIHSVYNTSGKYPGKRKDHRLEKFKSKIPRLRSPYATKFEDRSQEETERQQRCARSKAWNHILLSRERMVSTTEPEERKFVVKTRASMHMVSEKDFDSAELETMRFSKNPTTVLTANGEVQTREEATVNVKELDLLVRVVLLEETPAVLSLGKLCEDHGYAYHWTSGQKPHLTQHSKRIDCNPHLLLQHLHHRILYLTSAATPKIQYPKEVEVSSYGETCCRDQQQPKTHRSSEKIWLMKVVL